MKITIVYRYFWPDTPPYASMLRDMSKWFVDAGHDVEIITAQPAYKPDAAIPIQPWKETVHGVKIRRVRLLNERGRSSVKILNAGLFITTAFFMVLFGKKRDLVWTATIPPVLQAFALMIASKMRGAKFLYHMQDIYPEIASASGLISKLFPVKLFRILDKMTQKRAAAIVVLSEDMKQAIKARFINVNNVAIINNFSLILNDEKTSNLAKAPIKGEPVKFVFAGNVGRFQNLTALVKAFSKISNDEAILKIIGEGRAKSELQDFVKSNAVTNVSFYNHITSSAAFEELCKCHIGVVSLSPNIYKYAFPSKVLTYMAANLPMLAMVEKTSDLSKVLSQRKLGATVEWGSEEEEIIESVKALISDVRQGNMHPSEAVDIYHQNSARDKWLALLNELSVTSQYQSPMLDNV